MEKNQKEGYERRSGYYDTRQENGQRRNVQMSRAYTDDRYAARRTAGNSNYAQGSGYQGRTGNAATGDEYQRQARNSATGNEYQRQVRNSATGNEYQRQVRNSATGNEYQRQARNSATGNEYQRQMRNSATGNEYQRQVKNSATGNEYERQMRNGSSGNSNYAQRSGYQGRTGSAATGRNYQKRAGNASKNGYQRRTGKKRRRRKKKNAAFTILILVLILLLACAAGVWFLYPKEKKADPLQVEVNIETLDSPNAILIDKATGNVIASKNGDTKIYPASMTKIMTVLVAIEQIKKLDSTITMSYDYYDALYAQDASRAGFEPGEEAVIRDLLYGAMLPSGAECCMELAIQAAGSEAAMADLMNQKVTELGLTQTHFTNCTGLHSDEQYTTPHEMAKILQEALKNKTFREVIMTHHYTVKPTNIHAEGFTFWSTMFKNMQAENVIGGEILGGKTGYTGEAGHCLASFAEVDGREYILVTAGWAANPRTEQYHINDAFLGYNALGRALAEEKES